MYMYGQGCAFLTAINTGPEVTTVHDVTWPEWPVPVTLSVTSTTSTDVGAYVCVCVCYNGCEPVHACSSWRAQCWLLSTIARWWTTDVHLSGICRHCLLALSLFLSLAVSVFVRLAHRLKFTLAWFAKASISGPWCWSPPSSRSVSL